MDSGNLREKSVKIGKDRKNIKIKLRMPFGKRRVHSVSGRHHDDR